MPTPRSIQRTYLVLMLGNTLAASFIWGINTIFLLPWTTLAYAIMWDVGTNDVTGFEWFIVGLAFLADLGSWFGGRSVRRD